VRTSHLKGTVAVAVAAVLLVSIAAAASAAATSFIGPLHTETTVASAVPTGGPAKGDINPYGVVVVPRTVGGLVRGDVLVSNFNDAKNEQGTGKSIVEISPSGHAHVFAVVPRPTSAPAVGLTTALAVLRSGFVVVGSLPAPGGTSAHATAGALTIINSRGHAVMTVHGGDINGPWDMTAVDSGSHATLFVTNVLNGTVAARGHVVRRGTVVRITLALGPGVPRVTSNRVIATGFGEHADPNALVVGPTGLGLGRGGVLYVADSVANRIAAIPGALTRTTVLGAGGTTVASGGALNDPLGVAIAPSGDVVSVNGGDGRLQETTAGGHVAAVRTLIPNGGGDLFGLALAPGGSGLYYVDDAGSGPGTNSLRLLH
jgi:hypothetical protein